MGIKKFVAAGMAMNVVVLFCALSSAADSTGWREDRSGWRYFTSEDECVREDWLQTGGKWYYFTWTGIMISDVSNYCIDGVYYDFSSSGACTNPQGRSTPENGWFRESDVIYTDRYDEDGWYWERDDYDIWYYYVDGTRYEGWKSISGNWYYFGFDGRMTYCNPKRDPVNIDGENYWFKESGEMITGWYYDGVNWHCARSNGSLYFNEWYNDNGKWYYFDDSDMVFDAENYTIDGIDYNFDKNGVCLNRDAEAQQHTGWFKTRMNYDEDYTWFYYDSDGSLCHGWKSIGGKWYYFDKYTGSMLTGLRWIDSYEYYFLDSGAMLTNRWYFDEYDLRACWKYFGSDGAAYRGKWLNDGGKWYYFDEEDRMIDNCVHYRINGIDYDFDKNGVCLNPYASPVGKITGWYNVYDGWGGYRWYYYDSDGVMYQDKWLNSGNKWYYFRDNGIMVAGQPWIIDGRAYDFDEDGVCKNPYDAPVADWS